MKGTRLEEQVQNFNENMRNYETKRFFSFAKQLETFYFVFRETIETRRNSDLFRTVSYSFVFRETEKYETVNPTRVRNNSSRVTNNSSRARQTILPM